jgi:hypothetical protein
MNTAKDPKDRLDLSVRAARELSAAPTDGRASRSRILGELADRRRRHRTYQVTIVATILLLLIPAVSVGWVQLKRSIQTATKVLARIDSKKNTGSALAKPQVDALVALDEMPAPRELPEGPVLSKATPALPRATTTLPVHRPSELDLYARAHQMHFHSNAPGPALRLWTRYIERFPHGRFVPEAQFNRAVCLVRMGDSAAARSILEELVYSPGFDHPKQQALRLLAELR